MGLLVDAAVVWDKLQNVNYDLLLGRKGKWSASLRLSFCPEDFPHLAGMQYATDIDFGINKAEIHSDKFLSKILNKEIDDGKIEKAALWDDRIRGRLEGMVVLEETLDSDFSIYQFDCRKVPHGSTIAARYVIKDIHSGVTFFIFLDEDKQRWFCKSVFELNVADYTVNQTRVTVLKKKKWKNGEIITDYTHPNYRPVN